MKIKITKSITDWLGVYKATIPPLHEIKQRNLKLYAKQFNLKLFVETGTYKGDMIAALKTDFELLYSIELDGKLFLRAQKKFKKVNNIRLIFGDSGGKSKEVMALIDRPTLFYLDGHYSGGITAKGEKDTPIMEELSTILGAPDIGHVIIIDDAREFADHQNQAYPSIQELKSYVKRENENLDIVVLDDSIRITPAIQ